MARDPLPETIETHRLTLRPYALRDVDDVLAYAQDPEWARFLRDLPHPYGRAQAEAAVAQQIVADRMHQPGWAMVFQGRVIGGVVLILDFANRSAEIGYSVGRSYWNQGLGTEAVTAVIEAAFSTHEDLNRVWARTDPANAPSQRLLEKVGMSKEGVLRLSRVFDHEAVDEVYFSVLRREWEGP